MVKISAATGSGLPELVRETAAALTRLAPLEEDGAEGEPEALEGSSSSW